MLSPEQKYVIMIMVAASILGTAAVIYINSLQRRVSNQELKLNSYIQKAQRLESFIQECSIECPK